MEWIEALRAFFGWSIIVHASAMVLMFAAIMWAGEAVRGVHSRMFGLTDEDLSRAYFRFLAQYKVGIWLLAIGPWIALHAID